MENLVKDKDLQFWISPLNHHEIIGIELIRKCENASDAENKLWIRTPMLFGVVFEQECMTQKGQEIEFDFCGIIPETEGTSDE